MQKSLSIYSVLSYISIFTTIIPLIVGIKYFKYCDKGLKIATVLVGIILFTEIFSEFFVAFFNPNNISICNIYQIIETLLIYIIYYFKLRNFRIRFLIILFCLSFIQVSIHEFFLTGLKTLNNISLSIESITIIILCFMTFFQFLKESYLFNILTVPFFWINTAFLIYFSGNLFLHLFSQYLQEYELSMFYELWGWHSFLNITLNLLISIGFWKIKKYSI